MDFLIEMGNPLTVFLAFAALSALLAYALPLNIETSFTLDDIRQGQKFRQLERIEAALLQVRSTRTPNKELQTDWQLIALDGTAFEFELMLVTTVWGDCGEAYYQHRLKQSPFRWDIEGIVLQTRNKIEYA